MRDTLELLHRRVEERYPSYVAELAALVAIDSGSGDRAGVEAVGDRVATLLSGLGMTVSRPLCVAAGAADGVPAVVGRWRGTGRLRVLLVGHLDTVFAAGTAAARPYAERDGRATGPGVSDDKGGLLAGVFALDALRHLGWDDFAAVTFVGVPDEEVGSPGSRELLARLAAEHDVALCLECAREDGSVVIGRKGVVDVVLEVRGRSAHAGVEPERGVNAAVVAAGLAVDLAALNGRWPDVTVNVGVLRGGERPNVVPARACLVADVRAASPASYDEAVAAVHGLAERSSTGGATVTVELRAPAPPWAPSEASRRVAAAAGDVAARLGLDAGFALTGGAADANLLAADGLAVLDGLGPVGGDDHSLSEWLDLGSVVPRVTLLAGLMVELGAADRVTSVMSGASASRQDASRHS
ncbi:M20/M25/M40 family metallo-hydrolase [Nocardioides sp. STR2]|uniref:M20/M25/M40 family metallo-hydrolase n=1 Tax=Nocardioides pini TaxID=2975053 RepID=A0ABT4CH57_9ACTN|nr:M20/M25/M40 family metallo-hydrolase [Nocardioides pini]MCY4728293.1 M20/M25/M40 family metallo-hydrolase [Nocardioides pini]